MDGQCASLNWVIIASMGGEKRRIDECECTGNWLFFYFIGFSIALFLGWGNLHSYVEYPDDELFSGNLHLL